MKNLLVLVSGGRSSARVARRVQLSKKYRDYNKLFVFCNTGMERPETIDFLKNIVENWRIPLVLIEGVYSMERGVGVRHKIVDFDTLDMKGRVFSEMISHLNKIKWTGVPNPATPYCSEYLKVRPAHSFAKEIFGTTDYIKVIGFRKEDMPKRISWAEIKVEKKRIFPLLTDFKNPVSQFDLNRFFENERFKLKIHSEEGNCRYCWKKDELRLLPRIIRKDLENGETFFIDWHKKEEEKYGNMFFRNNLSIDDLVKLAKMPFTPSIDFGEDDSDYRCICDF